MHGLASPIYRFCLLIAMLIGTGCSSFQRVGMAFLFKEAPLGNTRVINDMPYTSTDNSSQRLNLFCPPGTNWPVMIFAFGGGWTEGDKGLRVGGKDVYGNIGRFYAARGIGVAVINYRLQPKVTWREQVDDVAAAVAWVKMKSSRYGADSEKIFLAGHSAGAHLVSFVALNPMPMLKHSVSPSAIKGVISVSGAGLDLADEVTYQLGASRSYYEDRFCAPDCLPGWDKAASPTHFVTSNSPPFLILYAGGEKKALQRQSQRLAEELTRKSIYEETIIVPGQSHPRMVLVLSRPDRIAAPAIQTFIVRRSDEF